MSKSTELTVQPVERLGLVHYDAMVQAIAVCRQR